MLTLLLSSVFYLMCVFLYNPAFEKMKEEIIDPGMDVHTITTTTTSNDNGRSRSNMPTFPDPGRIM